MASRLESDYNFVAGAYINDSTFLNHYNITIEMFFETEDSHEQSVALLRIQYLIYECFESCFFIHQDKKDEIAKLMECGFNICTLPTDAEDQIIAIAILKKLNAILEDKLIVTSIMINSRTSNGIRIYHDLEDDVDIFNDYSWWNNSKLSINNFEMNNDDKIVNINFNNGIEWSDINLVWEKEKSEKTKIIHVKTKE